MSIHSSKDEDSMVVRTEDACGQVSKYLFEKSSDTWYLVAKLRDTHNRQIREINTGWYALSDTVKEHLENKYGITKEYALRAN